MKQGRGFTSAMHLDGWTAASDRPTVTKKC